MGGLINQRFQINQLVPAGGGGGKVGRCLHDFFLDFGKKQVKQAPQWQLSYFASGGTIEEWKLSLLRER